MLCGTSFRTRVGELRQAGYRIETIFCGVSAKGKQMVDYQLIRPIEIPKPPPLPATENYFGKGPKQIPLIGR